jgi:hypothetical protein
VCADEDGSDGYLVDFQRKAVDKIVEERREEKGEVTDPPPSNPDQQW